MSDLTELFSQVARSAAQDPSREVVDADIARGRHALARFRRQRRARRAVVGMTAMAAAAAVGLVASQLHGSDATRQAATTDNTATTLPAAHHPTQSTIQPTNPLPVRLIAYTGKQLDGFTVDRVPDGWRLSGSTQYALTIDPRGDTNNDPDVFEGKLTVLLQSQDARGLPNGQSVTVDGHPGVIADLGGQALTYNDGDGHTVVVQAPAQLAWSNTQIVSFAEGVHVTANAIAGVG